MYHKSSIKDIKKLTEYVTFPSSGGTLKNDKAKSNTFSSIKTYRYVSDIFLRITFFPMHEDIQILFDLPFNIDGDFTCTPKVLSLAGDICTCNYIDGLKSGHNCSFVLL